MGQIAEINDGLRDPSHGIRATMLGLQGVELSSGGDDSRLPADALLVRLSVDGPPEYPYVHAQFRTHPGDPGSLTVEVHTDALRKLSHLLGFQHLWG